MHKFKEILCFSLFLVLNLTFSTFKLQAQTKYSTATVAFYNVENLFDTIESVGYINGNLKFNDPEYHISIPLSEINNYEVEDFKMQYTYENIGGKQIIRPLVLQEEFLPNGKKNWGHNRYFKKVNNIAKVIGEIGKYFTQNAPVIVGLSEIETIGVVEDITNSEYLKKYNYGIVHFNSFDARGVDVALIYQKNRFVVKHAQPHPIVLFADGKRKYTRDILQVTGFLDGEEITFLVNHWPSRSGGEKASMPGRIEAAKVAKGIIEDLRSKNPEAKVLLMGDLNDDPNSPSIKEVFNPADQIKKVQQPNGFYNPMISLFKKGIGTLAYRDAWNLFDQIIVTASLTTNDKDYSTYKLYKTEIFKKDYLMSNEGIYKGYPRRTWSGDTYDAEGYSDHFPVYSVLIKSMH